MEINNDTLSRIRSLSDDQLKDAISQVADILGASPSQKRRAMNNTSYIKRKIGSSSSGELMKYLDKITPQQQEELRRKLKF